MSKNIQTLSFNNQENLRWEVLGLFDVDFWNLSQEQLRSLDEFCTWLRKSIIFDKKTKQWKYKNLEKEERWSFTFPMSGWLSLPHLLHGGDTDIPYLQFDFDAYERWFLKFIEEIWLKYTDQAQPQKDAMQKILLEVRSIMRWGELNSNFARIEELTEESKKHMNFRSSCLDLLKYLWLDYWSDSEWCTTVPIEYIKM